MSARSFMSARQMEAWSHGQAIFDQLGLERVEHDRLRNIAVMGVNTFGWTFTVHRRPCRRSSRTSAGQSVGRNLGVERPGQRERGRRLGGRLLPGRHADAQRARHALQVTGAAAEEWMAIAQCFAGPPEQPPAPGTRFRRR